MNQKITVKYAFPQTGIISVTLDKESAAIYKFFQAKKELEAVPSGSITRIG